jgi:hypothetical protein
MKKVLFVSDDVWQYGEHRAILLDNGYIIESCNYRDVSQTIEEQGHHLVACVLHWESERIGVCCNVAATINEYDDAAIPLIIVTQLQDDIPTITRNCDAELRLCKPNPIELQHAIEIVAHQNERLKHPLALAE